MKQITSRLRTYVKLASLVLYIIITSSLILDFLTLHINPLYFYLLTLFIIVPTLAIYPKYNKLVLSVMFGFIIVGSAIFFLSPIADTISSTFIQGIGDNLNALGYYLLIDFLVAVVIYVLIQNYSLQSNVKRIRKFIHKNSATLSYLLFIIALILAIGPFWPISFGYHSYVYQTSVNSYNAILIKNYSQSGAAVASQTYFLIPVCSNGKNTSFKITVLSNKPAIFFYMHNYSGLNNLGVATYEGYLGYINANASEITTFATKGSLDFSIPGSCAEFGVLTEQSVNFTFHVEESYVGISYRVVRIPQGYTFINKTGDAVSSIIFIKNLYEDRLYNTN